MHKLGLISNPWQVDAGALAEGELVAFLSGTAQLLARNPRLDPGLATSRGDVGALAEAAGQAGARSPLTSLACVACVCAHSCPLVAGRRRRCCTLLRSAGGSSQAQALLPPHTPAARSTGAGLALHCCAWLAADPAGC